MYTFALASAVLASTVAANSLYSRQSTSYPAPLQKGPPPKQEWIDTYNRVKAEGKIPGFPPATNQGGTPVYPQGTDTGENGLCSWTLAHCYGDNDIYDAPDGMYAISFDDGPVPSSRKLLDFLKEKNQSSTHFMIGTAIVQNPDVFAQTLANGGHIGTHTWSHPLMTTLTDMEVLGELGWTSQAIYEYSGGLVPKFWRPPYGDADNRVRAIAEEVFGMILVGWNRDSNDWCLNDGPGNCPSYGPGTEKGLETELTGWMLGGKSPGAMGLEHESGDLTVEGFINTYAGLQQNGWDARCIPDLFNEPWYQNAMRNGTPATTTLGIGAGNVSVPLTSVASSSSWSSAAAASASSGAVTTSGSATASGSSAAASGSSAAAASASAAAAAARQQVKSSALSHGVAATTVSLGLVGIAVATLISA
ncbi:hypothetical protein C6P46_003442 [Rhodotorula mucilaginosa]|uniref:chitin deacetylase n=1 Tax=Rhodotorula mucilaginosa TaxID=5537 RepID=A0A9P6W4W3_RHOMI|nr:hypothetical protein C6P46_003442 [Rhodotorula mucilaginosa]TKA57198.1 hypothetical protein B0A53_01154 [Rhodotorula sp. CCFEE 5036]